LKVATPEFALEIADTLRPDSGRARLQGLTIVVEKFSAD
jgi:hypothetical protein